MQEKLVRINSILANTYDNHIVLDEKQILRKKRDFQDDIACPNQTKTNLDKYLVDMDSDVDWTSDNLNGLAALILSDTPPERYAEKTSLEYFVLLATLLGEENKIKTLIESTSVLNNDHSFLNIIYGAINSGNIALLRDLKARRDFTEINDFREQCDIFISMISNANALDILNFFLESYPQEIKEAITLDHILYASSHSDTQITDALKFPEFISNALTKAIQQADLDTLKRLSNNYPEEFTSNITIEHFTMAIEANSIEIYQHLLGEAAPEVVTALRGPFIQHAPKAIEKGNLDILKLLIDNFECQQGSVNAEFFIKLAHENQQWDILNYLINKYPDATKELDSFFKPILESLTAHIDELTINPEPTKNIELITLVKDLIKDNKISSAQLFVLAREAALFLKEETTDQYFSTFFIQWSYQNSQWPLLNSLVNQYPNLDNSFEMRLVSAMGQLNQLKIDNEQINEKKMELIAYVKLLENDEKISKEELVTVVNATYSLLKKDGFIIAEEYKALAKNIEGHSNPLMRAIGVAMMVIAALAMVAGTIIAATGIGIIPGSTVIAAGGAFALAGVGLFSGSGERGLAKKVTELSEILDNNTINYL